MPAGFGPIAGLKVGHAQDERALTGCTVFLWDGGENGGQGAGKKEQGQEEVTEAGVGEKRQQDASAALPSTPLGTGSTSAGAKNTSARGDGAAQGMVAACEVRGGAVGERELETLRPGHIVERIHALVFAGGSAFGLEAATGVMRWCEERGIGFDTGVARKGAKETIRVPIVPAAILFDLRIGEATYVAQASAEEHRRQVTGNREQGGGGLAEADASERRRQDAGGTSAGSVRPRPRHPDAAMGYAAAEAAFRAAPDARVAEGNVGAGTGATVGKLFGIERATKAGIGCWTEELSGGVLVAALAAVNALGDIRDPETGRILGGARSASGSREFMDTASAMRRGVVRGGFTDPNTVLVAVATNAALTRLESQRLAVMASAGMARVISPAHTTLDGDVVFALSIGAARADINALGAAAAEAVARAIARGVTQARSLGGVLAVG